MSTVELRCAAAAKGVPLPHIWERVVGSGRAALALRADYQSQLKRCHDELGIQHVRFHGLLCDDVGTLVCEKDQLLYSFFNADQIWDFLLATGMRPFVELSFMPTTLSSGSTTVFHYKGNVTPPRDYGAWATLMRTLGAHCVDRYGADEIRRWFFEVWNEPNLKSFWTGTQYDYFTLFRHTVAALKGVDPELRVGGPATADDAWIEDFLDFTRRSDAQCDFVSTHHYPTDAFGKPGDDTEAQLAASQRSVLRDRARRVHQLVGNTPLYYTEWSTSSNPRDPMHDEPYAAPVIVKTMLEATGLVDGYSYWTFSDIFEENYFPSVPFQGGFGLLTLHGIAKPSYRAFEVLHHLGTELIASLNDTHPTIDAWVVRSANARGLTAIVTNHALPRHPISVERVRLRLDGAQQPARVFVERIDADHANAKAEWLVMGSPTYLSSRELVRLDDASQVVREPIGWRHEDGCVLLELDMPPHAVAAITLESDAPVAAA